MGGIFEFEVQGVKRGFKFGTYAFGVAANESNCTTSELFDRCGLGDVKREPDLFCFLNLFYGAAVHFAKSNKLATDFNASDVSDWLEDIGLNKAGEMLKNAFNTYDPKNSASPGLQGAQTENGTLKTITHLQ